MTEGYANGMKLETSDEAVASFRSEFKEWVAEHPGYNFYQLYSAYSAARLYERAAREIGDARICGPLYRDYMKIVGHIVPKDKP